MTSVTVTKPVLVLLVSILQPMFVLRKRSGYLIPRQTAASKVGLRIGTKVD
jgi:hypothetical protein